jgi:hypothetical protein
MASNAIATVVKMMESLPESEQNHLVEHLREYITEIQDEDIHEGLGIEEWKRVFSQLMLEETVLKTSEGNVKGANCS